MFYLLLLLLCSNSDNKNKHLATIKRTKTCNNNNNNNNLHLWLYLFENIHNLHHHYHMHEQIKKPQQHYLFNSLSHVVIGIIESFKKQLIFRADWLGHRRNAWIFVSKVLIKVANIGIVCLRKQNMRLIDQLCAIIKLWTSNHTNSGINGGLAWHFSTRFQSRPINHCWDSIVPAVQVSIPSRSIGSRFSN